MEGQAESTPKTYDLESDVAKKIKKQVEFYFSDSNFPKDKFLRAESEKNPEGYVPIAILASFNRMKSFTTDVDFITAVIKSSDVLTVDETGKLVKRVASLPSEDTSARRSIYAKEFPQGISIEEVEAFFATYGKVQSVRLRRRADKSFKGSVFVEFATEEEVQAVLEAKPTHDGKPITVLTKQEFFKEKREERKKRNDERKRKANDEDEGEKEEEKEKKQEFESGLVIRFEGVGADKNRFDVQTAFDPHGQVKFVEYKVGEGNGYVRMATAEEAKAAVAALTAEKKTIGSETPITVAVIEGDEEKEYWQKIWEGKNKSARGGRGGRGGRGRRGGRGGRGRGGRGRGNKRQKTGD